MGILDSIGFGKVVVAPIEAIGNVIDKVYTSEEKKLSSQKMIDHLKQNPQQWIIKLNKIIASDTRLFNSGWRSFIGWICGFCLVVYYVPQYILSTYFWVLSCIESNSISAYPIDPSSLMQLVYLMLGFGTLKSFERIIGIKR